SRTARAGRIDPANLELRAPIRKFDPRRDGRPIIEERDADAALRSALVEPNRRAERRAPIVRKRGERAPLIVLPHEPRDRHLASARADRRPVDRTRVDLPAVVVDAVRRVPPTVDE